MVRFDQIPGYAEALAQEEFSRSLAFYDVNESIGPFEVVQMEVRHLLLLQVAGNPLLIKNGPAPSPEELTQFLLILHPRYFDKDERWRKAFFKQCRETFVPPSIGFFPLEWDKKRHARAVAKKIDAACPIIEAARKYVDDTFMDHMPGAGEIGNNYYSDMMFLEAVFSREYHYSPEQVMCMRVRKMFQALKEIKEHHALQSGRQPNITNRSDDALHEFALKQNQLRKN